MIVIFLLALLATYCENIQSLTVEPTPNFIPSQTIDSSSHIKTIDQTNLIIQKQYSQIINESSKSMNSPCQFNVSQSGSGKYSTIAEVLAEQCSETEGYEIALNDINHYEYLTVNQNASILIKGAKSSPTNWRINNSSNQTINLEQGNLTLYNINFEFQFINELISPSHYLIYCAQEQFYPSLLIHKCYFDSAPNNNTSREIIKFKNCRGYDDTIGALEIQDENEEQFGSEIVVENNTFSNNTYDATGGIVLTSFNQFSKINFHNNTFSFNKNNQESKQGVDAYLKFFDSPEYWTNQTIIEKDIKEMFKGSKTNAGINSVYYRVDKSGQYLFDGFITLSKLQGLSNLIIVLIVIGSVSFVAVIVIAIIIVIFLYKKKKNGNYATFYEKQNLILKNSLRSV